MISTYNWFEVQERNSIENNLSNKQSIHVSPDYLNKNHSKNFNTLNFKTVSLTPISIQLRFSARAHCATSHCITRTQPYLRSKRTRTFFQIKTTRIVIGRYRKRVLPGRHPINKSSISAVCAVAVLPGFRGRTIVGVSSEPWSRFLLELGSSSKYFRS